MPVVKIHAIILELLKKKKKDSFYTRVGPDITQETTTVCEHQSTVTGARSPGWEAEGLIEFRLKKNVMVSRHLAVQQV